MPAPQVSVATPPAAEPVSLADARAWLGLAGAGDDALLARLIPAARELAEAYTNRSFVTRTLRLRMDAPRRRGDWVPGKYDLPYDYFDSADWPAFVPLPRGPVQSVVSVTSYAADGTASALSASLYSLSGDRLVRLGDWPGGGRPYGAAEITYVAGYGGPADVPPAIQTAILQAVGDLYSARAASDLSVMPAGVMTLKAGDATITRFRQGNASSGSGGLSGAAARLLAPYRVISLA